VVSYHKGYNNNAPDNYYVTITVPSNISSVKVNEHEVNLDSPELSIVLPAGQTKSSGSMFFAALAPTLPLASWNFDEASGISAIDLIGSNNGTISNATRTAGIVNCALNFDGSSTNVNVPSNSGISPVTEMTMMAWVFPQENRSAKIFQKGDWDGHGIGQDLWQGWNCEIKTADNKGHSIEWGSGRPLLNEWYHLAMTYDGTQLSYYVNGVLKGSKPVSGNLRVNSRPLSIGSDGGSQKFFKGKIDEVALYGVALSAQEIQSIAQTSASPDKDGDGIPNVNDDYPDNPTMAFNNYYPAAGHGSLAFEDMWPSKGDYDFNDLVLDYRFNIITDASNFIAKISCNFVIKAIGAGYRNGFGFQLNAPLVDISTLDVVGATLDNTETLPTIIVFNNANNLMSPVSGFGVNVVKENPYVEPVSLDVHITFNEHIYTIDNLNMSEFNPFIFIEGDRAREVHLADFPPTKSASTALFGKEEDTSNPGIGRYYKTASNLPWAINLFSGFDHVVERIEITDAYLKFAAWAGSAGVEFPDWYLDKAGYRLSQNIY
ncbi:MAG: LruC domain-containing protein, partial [Bacteroidales bacterium]